MPIRPYRAKDASALAALAVECARGEADFVLNPLWESADELTAEFGRFGIRPEEHVLVADEGDDGDQYFQIPRQSGQGLSRVVQAIRRRVGA